MVAHPGESNLQQAAETCEFSQVPPLSMGLECTLSSVLLINIVGQASLDYQSTICQAYQIGAIHTADRAYYVTVSSFTPAQHDANSIRL